MLEKNKKVLDLIIEQLMKNKVLDQRDLAKIASVTKFKSKV